MADGAKQRETKLEGGGLRKKTRLRAKQKKKREKKIRERAAELGEGDKKKGKQ